MTPKTETPPPPSLVDIARGYMHGKILCAAVQLGIADVLSDKEKSLPDLAAATASNPDALYRLLRALAALGIVDEVAPERFTLTPRGKPFQKNAPNSVWASIIFWADLLSDSWTYLPECVRIGNKSGVEEAMKQQGVKSRWSRLPDPQAIFHAVFSEPAPADQSSYVAAYDFSSYNVVADLGGAGGSLLASILTANPHLRGVLVDRPQAIDLASQLFQSIGLTSRVQLLPGDLLNSVPTGAEAYILKCVLHGYDDDKAQQILRHCRDVMTPQNRLLIIEAVLPDKIESSDPRVMEILMSDINMLAVTGGRERSSAQWTTLLASTGFKILRLLPVTGSPLSIIESTRTD
jgi:precorrin-6B methylase 2